MRPSLLQKGFGPNHVPRGGQLEVILAAFSELNGDAQPLHQGSVIRAAVAVNLRLQGALCAEAQWRTPGAFARHAAALAQAYR